MSQRKPWEVVTARWGWMWTERAANTPCIQRTTAATRWVIETKQKFLNNSKFQIVFFRFLTIFLWPLVHLGTKHMPTPGGATSNGLDRPKKSSLLLVAPSGGAMCFARSCIFSFFSIWVSSGFLSNANHKDSRHSILTGSRLNGLGRGSSTELSVKFPHIPWVFPRFFEEEMEEKYFVVPRCSCGTNPINQSSQS